MPKTPCFKVLGLARQHTIHHGLVSAVIPDEVLPDELLLSHEKSRLAGRLFDLDLASYRYALAMFPRSVR